ncbi:hypothetical protein EPUS_07889 [Endocarpon pusillum Z07020]|uniref:Glycoside hydrolase n=1 Tax=Endocarpon pusillum (strain Z07020 / HMAS-L-300199) TaxID=1263415 RepID=U1GHE2_ENDPU|nr:uncharacterized protein EPUS_07889 [Endocarpon pusillum Z07020]ERF71206.1 hypothetical protein EPUS_07889 [Endocarpon pusillum Z07020]
MAISKTIPAAALPLAISVLFYSFINALASSLVLLISLSAIVITLSTVLSMIQQINYIVAWMAIKDAAYLNAGDRQSNPSYAFITTYNELDTIVFLIRFYCYNVQSLLFLFWAIGLWHATWKARADLLRLKDESIVLAAKIFAILFPILIVSTMRSQLIKKDPVIKLIWSNLILLASTTAGSIFLILILYTYIHVHRKAATKKPGPMPNMDFSFRMNRRASDASEMPTKPAPATDMRSIAYDRWLIARFLVCFGLSNGLQVCLIVYYYHVSARNTELADRGGPDYTLSSTLKELALSIPGVSLGLLIFIVFGTTAPFRREYRKWFQPCKRKRQGRDGPIMVTRLGSVNAANNELHSGQMRTAVEESSIGVDDLERRNSFSSTWQLPPIDLDGFSEKEVFPRSALGDDRR